MHEADLCGWRVRSDLPLPEVPEWGDCSDSPDVTVDVETGKADFVVERQLAALIQKSSSGELRLVIPGIADYRVSDGRRIRIWPRPGIDARDVRVFLFGPVLSLLCHQRGLLPLLASSVRIGDEVTAICGAPGIGKSTIAAAVAQRDYALVSDDVTVIEPTDEPYEAPRVLPTIPRVKLAPDSLHVLQIGAEGLERARPGMDRFYFGPAASDENDVRHQLRLGRIIVLTRSAGDDVVLGPLDQQDAATKLRRAIDLAPIAHLLGMRQAMARMLDAVIGKVPVLNLELPQYYGSSHLEQVVELVTSEMSP